MIIGLSGTLASGKGEFSEYLKSKGFTVYSLSDVIRDEVASRGMEITRDSLRETGNELRRTHGNGILAKRTIKKLVSGKNYIIDSVRNPEEVRELKKLAGFKLIFVDAPIRTRYERTQKRMREGEHKTTFDEFRQKEEKELKTSDPSTQQLLACKDMSDAILINDKDGLAAYRTKIDKLLGELK